MGVDVQCETCGSVSHEVLHAFNVHAAGNHHRGCGVAQIMHTRVRASDAGGDFLKILVEGMNGEMRSSSSVKTRLSSLLQSLPALNLFCACRRFSSRRYSKQSGGRLDRARLAALGGVGNVVSAVPFSSHAVAAD